MKAVGIIAEYNPFHNGHLYHLNQIRRQFPGAAVVAVMSGNFVQRGGPALLDKWSRTKMALSCGVDLVLELPVLYASQSAEIFAKGAVSVLDTTGIIDHLVFGSESNELNPLMQAAKILSEEKDSFRNNIKKYLQSGSSYPVARTKAMADVGIHLPFLSNDILGTEYIKQLILLSSLIKPYSIERTGSSYNSLVMENNICSASALRNQIRQNISKALNSDFDWTSIGNFIPDGLTNILQDKTMMFEEHFFELIRYTILRNQASLAEIFDIREGLEHLIYRSALSVNSFAELCERIKSKRYTMTRMRRILFNILLDIRKDPVQRVLQSTDIPYLRVLGFNGNGRHCLKAIKKKSAAPLMNKVASFVPENPLQDILFQYDLLATTIYNLIYSPADPLYSDYTNSPIYWREK